MIQANELRRGNWVNIPEAGINCQIDIIGSKRVCIDNSKIDLDDDQTSFELESLYPIPITEQRLIDLGLKKNEKKMRFEIGDFFVCYDLVVENEFTYNNPIYGSTIIDEVHTFQNLYFALKGEELNKS
tara:strand:+ start:1019 stop:1402 length:384 start_codon:yes stop_codon:yes gene_type:complete